MRDEMDPLRKLKAVEDLDETNSAHSSTIKELYRKYSRYVAFIAHKIVGDPIDVEDIVQDVFLAAIRGLRDKNSDAAIKSWLTIVTIRRTYRFLQRRKIKQLVGLGDAPDYSELLDNRATPEEAALVRSLFRQLDRLPVKDRIAWTLRKFHGESLERTAELAGCSRATAHRRITSASIALKEILRNE